MFHSIVYKIISIISAFSYKCFSVSWFKDITGNFAYFDVHLLMPGWCCQELHIDMIDHCMKEPIISPITNIKLVHALDTVLSGKF